MSSKISPQTYILLFFIVNLIQSYFTELAHDEAYYWVYSQHLDWGYFDHPPAVAVLIAMGYAFLKNELGVRLFIVIANTLTLWFIWKTVEPKRHHLFFLLFFSCLIAHVGFMAVPDIPLILCASAFLFFLKKYLEKDTWRLAAILGVIIAAMGYSKYHGIILLIPALVPNLHLLKRKSFWGMIVVASLLFSPHLYWQYVNDFPTFRFHLFDRSPEDYTLMFVLEYIGGQLLIYGPLVGFLLFYAAWKFEPYNQFDTTMKWCFYGTFIFFLFSSMKGRVEPNWTVAGIVPLIYLAYFFIEKNEKLASWSFRLAVPTLILIIVARLAIALDAVPIKSVQLPKEFHGWKNWAADLEKEAGDLPVVFFNNYQRAAKYSFYSGKKSYALNTSVYAGSQYDLLTEEQEALQGKKIMLVRWGIPHDKEGVWLGGNMDKVRMEIVEDFRFYHRVRIKMLTPVEFLKPNENAIVQISIENPTNESIEFKGNNGRAIELRCVVFEKKKSKLNQLAVENFSIKKLEPQEKIELTAQLQAPDKEGIYRYRFAIHNGISDERNCNFQKLEVLE